jgi:GDP-L-fucose synthase
VIHPVAMVQANDFKYGDKRILVTGGSGLVGEAVRWVIENESDQRFGRRENESWIFLASKEGDLR